MQKIRPRHGLVPNLVQCGANRPNSKLILNIMRIALIHATIAFTLSGMAVANNSNGQGYLDRQITMKYEQAPLKKALSDIEKQASIKFAYSGSIVKLDDKVTVDVQGKKLGEVLDELLKPRNIHYSEENGYIVLVQYRDKGTSSVTERPENRKGTSDLFFIAVRGRVIDGSTQLPLPGVNILEKGTTNGTVSDADGKFELNVGEGAVLFVSFIGYVRQEIAIGNNLSDIVISMSPDIATLEEIVVTGYGTQKKSDITGAIGSISSDEIGNYSVTNSTQILQGRVAGVMVTAESGSPGAGMNVRIRGLGTVNDNSPLYVIDGQPFNNMDNINPADIQSIEILKDASASAIYGARAANGVVLVTTKRGSAGGMKISVEAYVGASSAWKDPVQLNADEYYDMVKIAHQNGGTTVQPNLESEYQKGYNTNWWKEYTQKAMTKNYFLSISGGSENARYAVSGGYFKQEGLIMHTDYSRYTFRVNTDFDLTKKLKAGVNLSIINSSRNTIPEGARFTFGLISEGINMDPLVPVINPDADPNDPNYEFNKFGFTRITDAYNPVAFAARTFNTSKVFATQGNAYIDYSIIKDLVFRSNVGLYINNGNTYAFNPSFFMAPWEQRANNSVSRGFAENTGLVWENRLTYAKEIQSHSITAMVGFTSEEYNNEGFSGSKQNIPSNEESFRVLQAATSADQITGNITSYSLLSQFTRINYAFKDRYLLTATYRIDGSSRFAEAKRWGKFPSAAIGWRISNEEFFKSLDAQFIDNMKLRIGWGQIGNQNIPNYSYLSLISGGNSRRYTIGDVPLQGYSPSSVGNPDIKWETVEQTNVGLDLGLFEDRLSISADYYTKKTKDMLLSVPLPYYLGYPANPWSNEGAIKNSGLELQLEYRNNIAELQYGVGLNLTTIRNEVLNVGSGGAIFGGQTRMGLVTKTEEGHPIGSFYGFVTDGIFQNEGEVSAGAQPGAAPGDIRFKDIAGSPDEQGRPTGPDGIINENDRTYLGSPIPDYLLGLNLNLEYKRFSFTTFLQGSFGNEIYSATKFFTHNPVGYFNVSKEAYDDAWRGEGTSNSQPIITSNTANDNFRNSSFYVEDGSFLRIKNIQLTYSLPLKAVGAGELQFYVSCQNLFTFTKYSGLDPELGSSTLLDVGIDYGVYPQSRTLMAGVKFNY